MPAYPLQGCPDGREDARFFFHGGDGLGNGTTCIPALFNTNEANLIDLLHAGRN